MSSERERRGKEEGWGFVWGESERNIVSMFTDDIMIECLQMIYIAICKIMYIAIYDLARYVYIYPDS